MPLQTLCILFLFLVNYAGRFLQDIYINMNFFGNGFDIKELYQNIIFCLASQMSCPEFQWRLDQVASS